MTSRLSVLPSKQPGDLLGLALKYLDVKDAEGVHEATLAIYRTALGVAKIGGQWDRGTSPAAFLVWCEEQGIQDPAEIDSDGVLAYRRFLEREYRNPKTGAKLSPSSVRNYVTSTNHFLAWAGKRGVIEQGVRAKPPSRVGKDVDVLSPKEVDKLEAAAYNERDRLIIRALFETGGRLSEVMTIREEDLVEVDRRARKYALKLGRADEEYVGGKTGSRPVPVSYGLVRRIHAYVENTRPKDYYGSKVFIGTRRGADGKYHVPQKTTVARMLREAAAKAGFKEGRVHAHALRHAAITEWLRQGYLPSTAAQCAGHKSLAMVNEIYSHLNQDDAQKAFQRMMANRDDD